MDITTVKEIKKGDYFRIVNKKGVAQKRVFIKGDYDRAEKAYICCAFDDICDFRVVKSNQTATTDFIF